MIEATGLVRGKWLEAGRSAV